MLKTVKIIVSGMLTIAAFQIISFAKWVELKNSDVPAEVEVTENSGDRTVLRYSINGYNFHRENIDGKEYTVFENIDHESLTNQKGCPQLPRLNRSLVIPNDGVMGFEILSSEYIELENIEIAPSKGYIMRTVSPEDVAYEFGEVYKKDEFYPERLVNIVKPFIMRDLRGVTVELNAFQYNPVEKKLRIYTDITVEIKKTAPGGENVKVSPNIKNAIDPQFEKMYRHRFVNYSELDYPTLLESGDMLILCYDDFADEMEPFVEWKNQRGISTELVPLSETGNNWQNIDHYIEDYYYSHDLTYVLLVGDSAQAQAVPPDSGSDIKYAFIEGDDLFPEVFIGRLSAEIEGEVELQVQKFVEYEKYPDLTGDWYRRGLGGATNDGFGCSHYGEADNQHMTLIAYKLLGHTYDQVDSNYTPWGVEEIYAASINNGVGIINYCGHGGGQSWNPPYFGNPSVNALENDNMLPFIINVACGTGEFCVQTCFAEAWLRAANDNTGEPTGGIGAYMSRTSMGWTPGMYMQDEAVDLWVADSMWTFGGLCFNGGMYMVENDPPWGNGEFKNLTVFGDPSLSLRGDYPYSLNVMHNEEYAVGTVNSEFTVRNNENMPVKGIMVCLSAGYEIVASGITNSAGMVYLAWEDPLIAGNITLTVSGGDAVPYITEIPVVEVNGAYLNITDYSVQDDQTGNGNGQLEFFETASIGIEVVNSGTVTAYDAVCAVIVDHPLVEIEDDTVWIGDLASGEIIELPAAFNISLDPEIGDSEPLVFSALISSSFDDWNTSFTIPVQAPDIVFTGLSIADFVSGNADSLLDPGETADFTISLGNGGTFTGADLGVQLMTENPDITIENDYFVIDSIPPGTDVRLNFTVTASEQFSPPGEEVSFSLAITGEHGYQTQTIFSTPVGDAYRNPTGPDDYGYIAYDRYDPPYYTQYEWIELCPDSGGTGEYIHFFGLDDIETFDLPFAFTFYGQTYHEVSICTKGYICMGETNEIDYTETYIPSEDGPGAFVAAYWEDFDPAGEGSGGCWYEYIEEENIFVVEFNHTPHWYQAIDGHCTFETIFYDPVYYPTETGDGQIKFQYKEIYTEPYELYGTAGIENQTEDVGLSLRYDNNYPVTCATVLPGAAIFITTPEEVPALQLTLSPIGQPIIIPEAGGNFEFEISVENTSSTTQTFDFWSVIHLPEIGEVEVLNVQEISLGPGEFIERVRGQTVPGFAPGGVYQYYSYIGDYPWLVENNDMFEFEKEGTESGVLGDPKDWLTEGLPFENPEPSEVLPEEFSIRSVYPNPFNPSTAIEFGLPEAARISLVVHDIQGREVASLVNGHLSLGYHVVVWDAEDCASGVYFVRMELQSAGTLLHTQTRKVVLVK